MSSKESETRPVVLCRSSLLGSIVIMKTETCFFLDEYVTLHKNNVKEGAKKILVELF